MPINSSLLIKHGNILPFVTFAAAKRHKKTCQKNLAGEFFYAVR
ncbi:hypothetical protein C8N47_13126 [Mangrovibacterium marinum]|uniref:Uncharacterized protein n=1 Tax=Mangrovibacterium marinum TaxID=1639118 RepID=A0A2T5BX86_9BACT|nr:hypothetical protein C8N47_13126 [Mangrovibacterium marinum]